MKKIIGSLVILAALVLGGYVGYRMVFKGETFYEAIGSAQQKVETRLAPLRKADLEYGRGNHEEAVKYYKEALERSESSAAGDKSKLSPEKRRYVLRRIADSQYEMAARGNWPAEITREARRSYELLLKEYPDMSSGDREAVRGRILKLKIPSE